LQQQQPGYLLRRQDRQATLSTPHRRTGGLTASPVAADGKLYFTSEEGGTLVVKAGPEYQLLATNPAGEVCMATPAISDGMIFLRTQHYLYGIARTGTARRDTPAGAKN
jgi:hypothetical protein